MKMKYKGTLIAVKDMEKSKKFYEQLFKLKIIGDFGANVELSDGIFLQTADTWKDFIRKPAEDVVLKNNAAELYFETDDMDAFAAKLSDFPGIEYLHPLYEHSWGQRGIRFYDPDGHIIEVSEDMTMVVKRFMAGGLSAEETAKRMDVPVEYVLGCVEGN